MVSDSMNDTTILKMFGIGCLTALAIAYFAFIQKDGVVFGVVTTAVATIIGSEIQARRNTS